MGRLDIGMSSFRCSTTGVYHVTLLAGLVLASYDLVRTHMDEFDDLAWSVIFLDEAHKIKNHAASITKTYNRFQCQVRFGLTVTSLSFI